MESLVIFLIESHVKILKVFCHPADLSEYKCSSILNDIFGHFIIHSVLSHDHLMLTNHISSDFSPSLSSLCSQMW